MNELALYGTYVSDESVEAIVQTVSETLVKLDISSEFSFLKKLELASMPKLQVLGNSSASGENEDKETRKKQDAIIRKMLPLMTDHEFYGSGAEISQFFSSELKIAEPYPYVDFIDFHVKGLVPKRFWEIKS